MAKRSSTLHSQDLNNEPSWRSFFLVDGTFRFSARLVGFEHSTRIYQFACFFSSLSALNKWMTLWVNFKAQVNCSSQIMRLCGVFWNAKILKHTHWSILKKSTLHWFPFNMCSKMSCVWCKFSFRCMLILQGNYLSLVNSSSILLSHFSDHVHFP